MIRNLLLFCIVGLAFNLGFSQSIMTGENKKLNKAFERLLVKYRPDTKLHNSIRPYSIKDVMRTSIDILESNRSLSDRDILDIDYILADNIDWIKYTYSSDKYNELIEKLGIARKGILKYLYKNSFSLYAGHHKDFFIKVDPVINFQFGKDLKSKNYNFINTRGFKISGLLDEKIYFYTSLYETQQSFLTHVNLKIQNTLAIPGEAYYKKYESSVLKGVNGYDFLNAQAYIGFDITKHLKMQMGHGRFFIGNGIRSLLLSDYATNYFYLKFDTRVWKFHYRNIFTELTATSREKITFDIILPKKYMAAHYLSFKPGKNLEISLFESVIFSREKDGTNQFELQYLNPIILYRTVEQFIGSGDNVLVGLNWNYNIVKGFSLYGQLLLDEFNFSNIKKSTSYWANKYGFQMGIKYIDILGIDHLDLQTEANIVRPYTYSHRDSTISYSHYNQSLAHPLGANFKEFIAEIRYSPVDRLTIQAKALFAVKGEDIDKYSYGGNILLSNDKRPIDENGNFREFGFHIGDINERRILQYSINSSYMFYHNYFLDFNAAYRKETFEISDSDFEELYFSIGFRANIDNKSIDY